MLNHPLQQKINIFGYGACTPSIIYTSYRMRHVEILSDTQSYHEW